MKLRRNRRSPWALALAGSIVLASPGPSPADDKKPESARTTGARLDYVDAMLRASWEASSIKPSRPATDEEFLRRAYLDVLGRIPYIDEAGAFFKKKDAGKRAKLVEYLLAHPDYPKNFATLWKVVLLGRKNQPQDVDGKALTDWLRAQFLENRPWDKVAFDLVDARGSNKENGAVNFSLAHMADGAVQPHLGHDPGLPRPADPVYPVPRPPVERLEAGGLLGDQRLLQGHAGKER